MSFESYHSDIKYYMTLNTIHSVVTPLQPMWKMDLRYMGLFGYLWQLDTRYWNHNVFEGAKIGINLKVL